MGWAGSVSTTCEIHPNQKPHPGVCPFCLREKLTKLSAPNHKKPPLYFSSPPAIYCDTSSSYSPATGSHRRVGSDVIESISFAISGLKKSRSMAFVPRSKPAEEDAIVNSRSKKTLKKKRGSGFWSKLLGSSGKFTVKV